MGVASLVLGIVSVVLGFFGGWLSIVCGVIGIVLGALGKKKAAKCAVGGLVLSIIGTVLGTITFLACVACAAAANSLF